MARVGEVLKRNTLVLALHGFGCVAGFIAGSSLPSRPTGTAGSTAESTTARARRAIAFVVAATTFSLATQAFALGTGAATLSAQGQISPALLLLGLLAPGEAPRLVRYAQREPADRRAFQVLSLPTMSLFKAGQPVTKIIGAYPKRKLEARLGPALA